MKVSKKHQRDAARVAAASIRATIDGMIGAADKGLLFALASLAADLERKASGGTRDPITVDLFLREESISGEKP